MKFTGQFQKQPVASAPIPFSTGMFRSRPFPTPEAQRLPAATPDHERLPRRNPDYSRMFGVQPKLTVGAPNDVYEQEADRVAGQVMSMPDKPIQRMDNLEEEEIQTKPLAGSITPLVQRMDNLEEEEIQTKAIDSIQREEMSEEEEVQTKSLGNIQREDIPEEEEVQTKPIATLQREEMPEEEEVQTKSLSSIQREDMPEEEEVQTKPALQRSTDGSLQAGGSIESQINSSRGGGSPLPDDVRSFMEPRFGTDFSGVKVHTDAQADQLNRSVQAKAFTTGQDVFFRQGEYNPGSRGGQELIAHELTHVVQQVGGSISIQRAGGNQKGTFIGPPSAIHLHIDIADPHLKMGGKGKRINFSAGGGGYDDNRMREALNELEATGQGKPGYGECRTWLRDQLRIGDAHEGPDNFPSMTAMWNTRG